MIVYIKLKKHSISIDLRSFFCIFSCVSMIFSVVSYDTLKLLKYWTLKKVGFKIQPEWFLNLFLIFGEKFSLVSYKLVSYKKKRVFVYFVGAMHVLFSRCHLWLFTFQVAPTCSK